MLPENITAIVSRNERWSGEAASEPYEAGWAREAIFFVRALKQPVGPPAKAWVEISPDGMHWLREGTEFELPGERDGLAAARLTRFGNWLRIAARFENGAECTVLVTLHLKA
ncbi:hypothetical protein [Mesorhizobium sp. BE184]|uniref:hypothetical protein n=1 Tax=Mesorhizobium sp. BE184 TaxID=2817714 RepID=UPI00285DEDAB|nr:hypothetical protein [Mesorhizobium sp. BE184]MDR7034154.1 hypothetical protein [Mesorhizobium sp. BE184]